MIIPAYNEEAAVGAVVRVVSDEMPLACIVVVDDGSHDRTAEEAEKAGATVLQLPVNLGIGGAVQAGYRYALRHDFDYAVQIDGDGQHNPEEVDRILEPIQQGDADIVVGSRWLGRGEYVAPKGRRAGMRGPVADRVPRDEHDPHRRHLGLPGGRPARDRPVRRGVPDRLPRGRDAGPGGAGGACVCRRSACA